MSKHMKRLTTPTIIPVPRKGIVWIAKASPGAHPIQRSVPIVVLLRDMLKICDTSREARRIIGQRKILIDGKPARDYKIPVGLMDVISIPETKEYFRLLIDNKGKFQTTRISPDEAKWKLSRIEDKTTLKKGKTQLNLHDGRNIILDKDQYSTGTVLKIQLPSQKILGSFDVKPGNKAYLVGGGHIGQVCEIEKHEMTRSPKPNQVSFKEGFSTIQTYVFVIGDKTPSLSIPEAVSS
ncbi:MAG: 30S ribosomal protein S4e [Thermoplasmata archaeon]|nr:30S ribosomal protein S4e [Thermoplasmata archaeon]